MNAADGKELWKDKYAAKAVTGAAGRHPGPRSSPAVADGKIVTLGASGIVSCLHAGGKLLWRKDPFPNVVPKFFTSMSPIIDGQTGIYMGAARGIKAVKIEKNATALPPWSTRVPA